nr:reverse transcriptase domain-containing protein [Tanacetum cinerariifolium]
MSTRSSARNLFPPLENPELTIRRRSRTDPTLSNNSEMAIEGPGDLPSIKVNGVIDDSLKLYLFTHSLTHHSTTWFDRLLRNSSNTFKQMAKMFLGKYFPPSMVTKLRNEMANFCQRPDESVFEAWELYKLSIDRCPNHNMLLVTQIHTLYNGLSLRNCDTINAAAGGTFMKRRPGECYDLIENMTAHHNDWDTSAQRTTVGNNQNVYAVGAYQGPPGFNQNQNQNNQNHNFQNQNRNQGNHHLRGNNQGRNQFFQGANQGQNQPPAYQALAYQASVYQALVHQPQIPQPQVVTTNEFTNFMKANDDAILKNMQTNMTSLTNSNLEHKNMFGPTIPTTSSSPVVERETEATKDTMHPTTNESTEDVQPSVVQSESPILTFEPVNSLIIEHVASPVSAPRPNQRPSIPYPYRLQDQKRCEKANNQSVLLKKLPEKLGDPSKFLISCDFPGMAECLALADLGASINLMTLSVWNRLFLPDLSPACMTLKLVDRLISRRLGLQKMSSSKALIDVFEGELTLRVGKEAITFNLDQTSRYSANYSDMTAKRIDVIDMACEDDFLLEEVDAFLALEDDPTSPEVDQSYLNSEGDIVLLKAFMNDDPSLPLRNQVNYLPEVRKELKICEAKSDKSSIDEPSKVELKDLPPHLEYAFLEGDDKLPVIIVKYLSMEEKTTLITVLKSHKRAIAWKHSDIKGIDLEFCTHKILMEEDFKPAVQHQRRVNPKIHDVIKQEVLKLLDAGLIYPISDSPYVSPVHCVPKKGGFTVVENEDNDLILTRLVTDQEKTTFTYPYGTFAYRRMPFGLCNAPGTFQRCMMAIFHDMIKKTIEVFIDDFSNFGNSFKSCLSHLEKMLKRSLLNPRKLTEACILIAPDWDMPFELMCDASDFAIGAVLGQRQEKHIRPIHYASNTMTEAESNYTTTKKEMLAVVYAFEKFRSYLIMNKSIVYTDHSALKYLFAKKDSKARLLR